MEYWELLPHGCAVMADVYCVHLRKLRKHILSTRGKDAHISFLHLNAQPQTAKVTQRELASYGWRNLPHPPYSPGIAPSDFHLFSALQRFLNGQDFSDEDQVKTGLRAFFRLQSPEFWANGIHSLPDRWQKVAKADSEYH